MKLTKEIEHLGYKFIIGIDLDIDKPFDKTGRIINKNNKV